LPRETFQDVRQPFYVATISKGRDHIQLPEAKDIRIIAAHGDANAIAVAELAVLLATLLFRRVDLGSLGVLERRFTNVGFLDSRRLEGLTWACIGAGAQVRKMIPRLAAWGLRQVLVYHPSMSPAELNRCVADVPGPLIHQSDGSPGKPAVRVLSPTGATVEVVGTPDVHAAIASSDVVSIHVPLVEANNPKGRPATRGLFDAATIARMKDGAILINVARGAIVNEAAALAALETGKLYGLATDVLNETAEATGDPVHSPLWQAAIAQHDESLQGTQRLNLIVTPHMGGTTRDAIESVASEVVRRLLGALGLPPDTYKELD
jgi:phosphoglycerate dehydrogenase-like enzyme